MNTKYYGFAPRNLQHKNKLEKDIADFLKTLEDVVVNPDDLEQFQTLFDARINQINAAHPRCGQAKLNIYKSSVSNDVFFHVADNYSYVLKPCRDFSGEVNQLIEQAKGKEVVND